MRKARLTAWDLEDYPGGCGAASAKTDSLREGDVLCFPEAFPSGVDKGIYERIMARLSGRGIQIAVDAEKDLLLRVFALTIRF